MGVVARLNELDDRMLARLGVHGGGTARDRDAPAWLVGMADAERRELRRAAHRCEVAADPERARQLAELERVASAHRAHRFHMARLWMAAAAPLVALGVVLVGGAPVVAAGVAIAWVALVHLVVRSVWVGRATSAAISNRVVADVGHHRLAELPDGVEVVATHDVAARLLSV